LDPPDVFADVNCPQSNKAAASIQCIFRGGKHRENVKNARFKRGANAVRAAKRVDHYMSMGIPGDELAHIKQCFTRYDGGSDGVCGGFLTPPKLAAAVFELMEGGDCDVDPEGEDTKQMFAAIDINSDGAIELDEFTKWWVEGSDDIDANFMKWWWKGRWAAKSKDPEFLGSAVTRPPKGHSILAAYDESGAMTMQAIDARINLETELTVGKDGPVTCSYTMLSQRGYYPESLNKANQDSYAIHPCMHETTTQHLFAVYDGHGQYGDYVSNQCRANFGRNFSTFLPLKKGDVGEAAAAAAAMTEQQMEASKIRMSGTTCCFAYLDGRSLHCGNVGDSRCVLGVAGAGGKLQALPMSDDQTPYRKDERERVRNFGGKARIMNMDQLEGLEPYHDNWNDGGMVLGEQVDDSGDPPRVWHATKAIPGAAFTRSIGDTVGSPLGIITTPEMRQHELRPGVDRFCIVASDGVWEFMTSQSVVDMVVQYIGADEYEGDAAKAEGSPGADEAAQACRHVVAEAYRIWMTEDVRTDDITMILVRFGFGADGAAAGEGGAEVAAAAGCTGGARGAGSGSGRLAKRRLKAVHQSEVLAAQQVKADAAADIAAAVAHQGADMAAFEPAVHIVAATAGDAALLGAAKAALATQRLFAKLPAEQTDLIASMMEKVEFAAGAVVIDQGTTIPSAQAWAELRAAGGAAWEEAQANAGAYFYIAEDGTFDVQVQDAVTLKLHQEETKAAGGAAAAVKALAAASHGDKGTLVHTYERAGGKGGYPCFGDLALLKSANGQASRAATVTAKTASTVWRLGATPFTTFLCGGVA
jgi:serine/threonine protein phosphatase PrpC/CRP-like cAMP-binding protein